MYKVKNFFHEFWVTPLPEFIVNKVKKLFRWMKWPSKELTSKEHFTRSSIISVICLVTLIILTKTFNPISLFLDIPYLSADEYLSTISNWNNTTWTLYMVFSGICIACAVALINSIIFHNQPTKVLSLEGLMHSLMIIILAMLIDYLCQDVFRVIHEKYVTNSLVNLPTLIISLLANFGLFFILQDAFTNNLSLSLTPMICKALHLNLYGLGFIHFLAVAVILKVVLGILDKTGIWDVIIEFMKKWCYTPKYIWYIVTWFYRFVFVVLFMGLFTSLFGSKEEK